MLLLDQGEYSRVKIYYLLFFLVDILPVTECEGKYSFIPIKPTQYTLPFSPCLSLLPTHTHKFCFITLSRLKVRPENFYQLCPQLSRSVRKFQNVVIAAFTSRRTLSISFSLFLSSPPYLSLPPSQSVTFSLFVSTSLSLCHFVSLFHIKMHFDLIVHNKPL